MIRLVALLGVFWLCWSMPFSQASELSHFPSPSGPWTTREYIDFYFAHYNGNRALPHLRTEQTAALFRRIVDPANVERITNGAATPEEKRLRISVILAMMGAIRSSYNYAVVVGEPLQEELVQIQGFMLYLIAAAVQLHDDLKQQPSGAPAWATAFWGAVASLSERSVYTARQRIELIEAIERHYPQIDRILLHLEKAKFRKQVRDLAVSEPDPEVRKAYDLLQRTAARF